MLTMRLHMNTHIHTHTQSAVDRRAHAPPARAEKSFLSTLLLHDLQRVQTKSAALRLI